MLTSFVGIRVRIKRTFKTGRILSVNPLYWHRLWLGGDRRAIAPCYSVFRSIR
jgi:hypothetical protein